MRPYLSLGSAPAEEDCVQLGTPNYAANARQECEAYIDAIRTKIGPEPQGAEPAVKPFPHEAGSYYGVVCYYGLNRPAAKDYTYRREEEAPASWAEVNMTPPVRNARPVRRR